MTTIKRQPPSRAAAWMVVCMPLVMASEGMVLVTSRDPIGIPTYCFGETQDAILGEKHSEAECKALLPGRLSTFNDGLDACLHVPVGPYRRASLVSFSYNVGTSAACGSTLIKKLNNGAGTEACAELSRWVRAGGIVLRGLVKRRKIERAYCERNE
jgi:lysozyme